MSMTHAETVEYLSRKQEKYERKAAKYQRKAAEIDEAINSLNTRILLTKEQSRAFIMSLTLPIAPKSSTNTKSSKPIKGYRPGHVGSTAPKGKAHNPMGIKGKRVSAQAIAEIKWWCGHTPASNPALAAHYETSPANVSQYRHGHRGLATPARRPIDISILPFDEFGAPGSPVRPGITKYVA